MENDPPVSFESNGSSASVTSGELGLDYISPIRPPPPQLDMQDVTLDNSVEAGLDVSFNTHFFRFNHPRRINDSVVSHRATRSDIEELVGETAGWSDRPLKSVVYIDDFNVVEKVRHSDAISTMSQTRTILHPHAQQSEGFLDRIGPRTRRIGMQINEEKTQLLCISASTSQVESYVNTPAGRRTSTDSMKLVGFWFSSTPTVGLHIDNLLTKLRIRLWYLRHLKASGMVESKLLFVYTTMILPVHDFTSITYHSMLSGDMAVQLERIQLRALKIIYGEELSYRICLEKSQLCTLSERREKNVLKFAQKMTKNQRYSSDWFPEKQRYQEHELRNELKYTEVKCRSERLRMSPIYYLRRALNNAA